MRADLGESSPRGGRKRRRRYPGSSAVQVENEESERATEMKSMAPVTPEPTLNDSPEKWLFLLACARCTCNVSRRTDGVAIPGCVVSPELFCTVAARPIVVVPRVCPGWVYEREVDSQDDSVRVEQKRDREVEREREKHTYKEREREMNSRGRQKSIESG